MPVVLATKISREETWKQLFFVLQIFSKILVFFVLQNIVYSVNNINIYKIQLIRSGRLEIPTC